MLKRLRDLYDCWQIWVMFLQQILCKDLDWISWNVSSCFSEYFWVTRVFQSMLNTGSRWWLLRVTKHQQNAWKRRMKMRSASIMVVAEESITSHMIGFLREKNEYALSCWKFCPPVLNTCSFHCDLQNEVEDDAVSFETVNEIETVSKGLLDNFQ